MLNTTAEVLLLEERETRALLLFVARVLVVLILIIQTIVAHRRFKRFDGWLDLRGLIVLTFHVIVTLVDLWRVSVGCKGLLTTRLALQLWALGRLLLRFNEAGEAAADFRRLVVDDRCRLLAGVIHIVDAEGLEHAITHACLLVLGRQRRQDGTLDAAATVVTRLALLLGLAVLVLRLTLVKCRLYTCLTVLGGEAVLSLILQRTRHALIQGTRHLIFKLFGRSAKCTLVLIHGNNGALKKANSDLVLHHSLLRSAK